MSLDDSQLRQFSEDLGFIPRRLQPQMKAVIKKGAVNIKGALQKDLRASSSFDVVARSVDFDELTDNPTTYGTEIGPNKSRYRTAGLAGFAYFGGAMGGGGTVRDPAEALADEVPAVEEHLANLWEGLL